MGCVAHTPRKVHELLGLVSNLRLDFIFLMETKCHISRVEFLKDKLGFEGIFFVPRVNNGGGLVLFWREKGIATLLGYSRNFIDIAMTVAGMEDWHLMCLYGHPERRNRETSWSLMKNLAQ